MNNAIKELWHGNIIPQEDSRTNSQEMKELLGDICRPIIRTFRAYIYYTTLQKTNKFLYSSVLGYKNTTHQ